MKPHILRKLADTMTFQSIFGELWMHEGKLRKFIEEHSQVMWLTGGALRDTLLGKEIADFDFIINVKDLNVELLEQAGFKSMTESLRVLEGKADEAIEIADSLGGSDNAEESQQFYDLALTLHEVIQDKKNFQKLDGIVDVYDLVNEQGYYQVIIVACDLYEHVLTYGTFLSQVWIDLKDPDVIKYNLGFQEDVLNNTLTVNPICKEKRLEKYIKKIEKKYPKRKLKTVKEDKIERLQTIIS